MFTADEAQKITAITDTMKEYGIIDDVELTDNAAYIHRQFPTFNENPMALHKEDGKFLLLSSDHLVVAEGETVEDALQPWLGLYERLAA
ncbi:MAG TPA: hypothetical protein VM661_06950 [Candidatus Sulfotelmatobacter sp.]|jgi:hypothetical protein|nr:hypothetical protein [Candidatus Sulfotelmatobacter sp.]